MKTFLAVVIAMALATAANAGALEECMIKGDSSAVSSCLLQEDKETQAALFKAEGDAGRKAREMETATGKSGAQAALARSMRAFAEYRKAQCDFVKMLHGASARSDQAALACMIDITRRRVRDLIT